MREEKREEFRIAITNQILEPENEGTTAKLLPTHSRNLSLDDFVKDVQLKLANNTEHMKNLQALNACLRKDVEERTEEKNRVLSCLANCNDYQGFQNLRQQLMSEKREEMVVNRKSSGFPFRRNEDYEEAQRRSSMTHICEFDSGIFGIFIKLFVVF